MRILFHFMEDANVEQLSPPPANQDATMESDEEGTYFLI